MRVAVTGGSGVVGRAVVRHLVDAGHEVSALARSSEASAGLDGLGAAVIAGDLFDETALARLAKGRDQIFHVAGVNELCSLDPSLMWRVNVEGTLAVLRAGQRAGVSRLIHTSSAVTVGEEHGTIGSETSHHRGHFLSEYERSKTVAERLLFEQARDIDVVSVNPSSVQGPGRSTGTGALFLAMARGGLPVLVDTTISLIDIDDCARGHLLAADRGVSGQRYLLSGPVLTVREGVRSMNQMLGRHDRPWFVKREAVELAAPMLGALFAAIGRQPLLCTESARVLLSGHRYDGSKAERDLGIEYTPLMETLDRTINWFRQEGFLD